MQDSRSHRNRLRRAVAGLIVPAVLAIGCGDDVKKATVTEENVLALGIAATETTSYGAATSLLLAQLGYFLPASVIVSPADGAPSPGIVVPPTDPLCVTGTSSVEVIDTDDEFEMTTIYGGCTLEDIPCLVNGIVIATAVDDGVELQADDLDVTCDEVVPLSLTDESAVCGEGGCDVDLNSFESAFDDTTVKPKSLFVSNEVYGGLEDIDADGTTNLSGEGQFDFETLEEVTIGCDNGMPTEGVIAVQGSGDSWGALVFDDETCTTLEVCFAADQEAEPDCDDVPFPTAAPMPI